MIKNRIVDSKIKVVLFLLILILCTCGREGKKNSNLLQNSLIDTISQESRDSLFIDLDIFKDFINNYSDKYFIEKSHSNIAHTLINKTEYLEYYKCRLKQKKSFKNQYNQVAFQIIDCFIFEYESKTKCNTAIDSLFNCFPFECQKLPKEKYIKALKSPPSIFILNDKHIIIATIPCEQEGPDWDDFKTEMINNFTTSNSKVVSIGCGGPLKWY